MSSVPFDATVCSNADFVVALSLKWRGVSTPVTQTECRFFYSDFIHAILFATALFSRCEKNGHHASRTSSNSHAQREAGH